MTKLIGSREHGIKWLEDFTSEKARQEAKSRLNLDVKGTRYMKLTHCFDHVLERREYALNAASDLKLVHYGKSTSPERRDRAAVVMEARRLVADILANRNSSADEREEILRQIKDQSSGGGGGGASAAA